MCNGDDMLVYVKNTFKHKKKKTKEAVEYQAWLEKHKTNFVSKRKEYVSPKSITRPTRYIPSLDSGIGNATKPVEGIRYTGDKMIGIATMHKSNAVPVFQADDCKAISGMRR
jgi:hypothetical protein